MTSKDVDFGNEQLNAFVNKVADATSSTTDKVLKTVDKTVDNIKNRDSDDTNSSDNNDAA
ncbi:MAG: hypothetical protein ACK5LC_04000 [Coprobacillaceae bacterium]